MSEILRIAVGVATPLSLLALIATLGYFAFTRRLTHEEERLRALPPDQRAPQTDEYLTRYGIDGKDLSPSAKLSLIRDEMQSRHRRSVVYVAVASLVFVVCFAIAVFAYVSQRNPTDSLGDTSAKEIGFIASNLAEPFAVKGQFGGKANVTEKDIDLRVQKAIVSFPARAPDGGDRYVDYVSAGLACRAGGTWAEVSQSQPFFVKKPLTVGQEEDLGDFTLSIPRLGRTISGCWIVFDIAERDSANSESAGFSHAHTRKGLF